MSDEEQVLVYPDGPDSLPAYWDKEAYEADPEAVKREILRQRAALALDSDDDYEPMPDYDALVGDDSDG